ncbi:hypothetical protein TVAG_316550 [Trichomonas vaginalis G3]|uniref:Raptor N-terminal CASPase-like domain-containing protein n=1 Tax=Trichomonas vaginalis (strain ATCC PRA-98 / G3) TaxID=412133 RepID=A2G2E2_TRIV3|nr:TOR signaling [Trichomonas vaginalis G3]EAX88677.1 hypothetical protein TVAG_316550 [Trichomonas vaginalis G3]KAI5530595.1 TOR signaling [Trichomonas vaginalis G3]|eukprot:XP_001301607.1 hypothetical protein [Trichomonas vaginalis G3]
MEGLQKEKKQISFYSTRDNFVGSTYSSYSEEEDCDNVNYYQHLNNISKKFIEIDFENTESSNLPSLTDADVDFKYQNRRNFEQKMNISSHIECIFGIYADKTNSQTANPLIPQIIMWKNIHELSDVDYRNQLVAYIRSEIKKISKTRDSLNVGLSFKKLQERFNVRRDVPDGRILLHFLGYNHPKIEENKFYLPNENKPIPTSLLFDAVQCPSIFMFDCNNAAVVLKSLESYANSKQQDQTRQQVPQRKPIDWTDWFAFCVTDISEEIPVELHLPHDFLTSCVFTPVEISLTCHILQNFRNSHVGPCFPIDETIQKLLDKKRDKIMRTVLAISDAIAAASLPEELYDKLIRKDPLLKRITEGFLLSQFLLKNYQIHPQSYPMIKDCSSHRLWQNLKSELNSVIYSSMSPFQDLQITSIFKMAIDTVRNNKFAHYKPEYYSLILNSIGTEYTVEAFTILSEFASFDEERRKVLSRNANFSAVFNLTLNTDPFSPSFHSLLYLVCCLIEEEPASMYELPMSQDFETLINLMSNEKLNSDTKTLICVLLTSLSYSMNANIQRFMTIENVRDQIILNLNDKPRFTSWLLLLAKKFYDTPNVSKRSFISKGYHARIAFYILHKSYEVRAALFPLLESFLGVDDSVDCQIFLMLMFSLFDCSPLVRYSYVTFLEKFIESKKKNLPTRATLKMSESYNKIAGEWTLNNKEIDMSKMITNREFMMNIIDRIAESPETLRKCVEIALFSISLLAEDPNKSVQEFAFDLDKNLNRYTVNEDMYTYSSVSPSDSALETLEIKSSYNPSIFNYNDSCSDLLYRIFLRQVIESKMYKPLNSSSQNSMTCLPPAHLNYIGKTTAVKTNNGLDLSESYPTSIVYDKQSREYLVCNKLGNVLFKNKKINVNNLSSIEIADWHEPIVIAGTSDGCVTIWNPKNYNYTDRFRADLVRSNQNLVVCPFNSKPNLLTSRGIGGVIRMWDIEAMRFAGEWAFGGDSPVNSICLSPTNSNLAVVCHQQDLVQIVDIRQPEKVNSFSLDGTILSVHSNLCNNCAYLAATREGQIFKFNESSNCNCIMDMQSEILSFTASQTTPIIAVACSGMQGVVANLEGNVMHNLPEIANCCAAHQNLPLISFGTQDGCIVEYQISMS